MDTPGPSTYLALLVLIAFSAFFSASETALTSVNRIRLKNRAEAGDRRARTVLRLSDDFDATLSTILIGNNVVNNAAAAIATVVATALLGASGATVATLVITAVVLIFGEILPKSFAKEAAEPVALACGRRRPCGGSVQGAGPEYAQPGRGRLHYRRRLGAGSPAAHSPGGGELLLEAVPRDHSVYG